MKERELREAADCKICGQPIGKTGVPLFYRVTVQMFGLDLAACQRQEGLAMMLGGHAALAMVMGPDEDLAKEIGTAETFTVCTNCATTDIEVARLHELGGHDEDETD